MRGDARPIEDLHAAQRPALGFFRNGVGELPAARENSQIDIVAEDDSRVFADVGHAVRAVTFEHGVAAA